MNFGYVEGKEKKRKKKRLIANTVIHKYTN